MDSSLRQQLHLSHHFKKLLTKKASDCSLFNERQEGELELKEAYDLPGYQAKLHKLHSSYLTSLALAFISLKANLFRLALYVRSKYRFIK